MSKLTMGNGSETPRAAEMIEQDKGALNKSEELYRTILQTAMNGFWMADTRGRLLDVNETYCGMSGFSKQELLTMNIADLEAVENSDEITGRIQEIMALGEMRFESRHRRKDGSIIDVEISAQYRSIQGGRTVAFIRDISELKKTREILRESEQSLQLITDNLQNIMVYQITAEPDGGRHFTFVSRTVERLNEVSVEEVLADANVIYGQILPEYLVLVKEREEQALKNLIPLRVEVQSRLPSGRMRWFEYTSTPRYRANGQLVWDGVEVDITEPKLAEEALRESEERFRKIFEQAQMGIVITSTIFEFEKANPAFCRMLGYSADELRSMTFADITHPDHLTQDLENVQKVGMGEIPFYQTEKRYIHKNGNVLWGNLIVSSIRNEHDGTLRNYISFIEDLTELKRTEQGKTELESQLQQAQKMGSIGRLAGGVAHDLNNMLGIILGHTEIALEKGDPSQPIFADLMEIRKAANRSADLTRQLLAFARKQTIVPKVLDLNETVEGALRMLRRLIGEDIDLAWLPGHGVWPVMVDPSQIDQILANLFVNARDAIVGVGKITIETGNATLDEEYCAVHAGFVPGEYVRLSVSDSGCGMEKEMISHIFEPFFTTKKVGEGTGLGLATVYGVIKQNKGFINLYSETGQGTIFNIYLPRHVNESGQALMEGTPEVIEGGQETILLVEDEMAVLRLTKLMLERMGYTVLAANTTEEAVRKEREHVSRIHLLITDVIMPGMNGRELFQQLSVLRPDLKCAYMSGFTANVIAHHGVLDEGVHFIQKPFSKKDLAANVRAALDQKS
jgi:two-component system, cell cycle sensor histidine kinase and response regulator CckA